MLKEFNNPETGDKTAVDRDNSRMVISKTWATTRGSNIQLKITGINRVIKTGGNKINVGKTGPTGSKGRRKTPTNRADNRITLKINNN